VSLTKQWIDFGPDKAFRGYLAYPASSTPLPALILIQEAWGVDAHIQDAVERYAAAGYVVLSPDLYWKDGGRPKGLSDAELAEIKAGLGKPGAVMGPEVQALFAGIQAERPRHLAMLLAAAAWLKDSCEACKGSKLGAMGFCMGGGLAGQLAADQPGLAASIIFYGQAIPPDSIPKVGCKVLCFHGQSDTRLVEPLPACEAAMKAAGKDMEVHVYQGAGHAFFNDTRPSYNATAARDAFARSLQFLNQALS
jgi:carboxymethylenebutenolidase